MSPNRQDTFDIDAVFRAGDINVNTYMEMQGLRGGVQIDHGGPDPADLSAADRFVVEEALARGGMGMILAARDVNIRRVTAMKVLTAENPTDKQLLRFIEEAQITGQLEHPNIVPVHELGVSDSGRIYYTMKMVEGVTLLDVIKGVREHRHEIIDKYPISRLLTVFAKVCDAVAFAHSRGVIHRDLKPDNVMIGDFGEVLLMDWGLAKVVGDKAMLSGMIEEDGVSLEEAVNRIPARQSMANQRTLEGQILGTPNYMPPEQAAGKISELDKRTDIYSLGGVLYDLLCLRAPIEGANLKEMVEKINKGYIPNPNIYNPRRDSKGEIVYPDGIILHHCPENRVPEATAAVAMKAMSFDPNDRYQTVEELQEDIFKYQTGFATSAESASPLRLLTLTLKRHKRESIFICIALIIAILMTAFFIINLNGKNASLIGALEEIEKSEVEREKLIRAIAPRMVEEAEEAIQEGKWDTALRNVTSSLELRPDNPRGSFVKARCQMAFLQLDQAQSNFKIAEALAKDDSALLADVAQYRAIVDEFLPVWISNKRTLDGRQLHSIANKIRALDQRLADQFLEHIDHSSSQSFSVGEYLEPEVVRVIERDLKVAITRLEADNGIGAGELKALYPVQGSTGRVTLELFRNQGRIVDISALENVPINDLSLEGTSVSDLSPLAKMKLSWLNLNKTEVTDLSPLKNAQLIELHLEETPLSSLNGIDVSQLKTLFAEDSALADISALKDAPIQELQLKKTKVRDLAALAGNTTLTVLNAEYTLLADIGPLRGVPLRDLRINRSQVRDLSPLRGTPLTHLNVRKTRVTDLAPLAGNTTLEYLNVGQNSVSSLKALVGVPLTQLYADLTHVRSLNGLQGSKLSTLYVDDTKITSLAPLLGAPLLRLSADNTRISDLSALTGLPIQTLSIENTAVADIAILGTLPLAEISLIRCKRITALTSLLSCKTLVKAKVPVHLDPCVLKPLPNLSQVSDSRGHLKDIKIVCP